MTRNPAPVTHFPCWVTQFFMEWHENGGGWHESWVRWHGNLPICNIFLTIWWFSVKFHGGVTQKWFSVTLKSRFVTPNHYWVTPKPLPVTLIRSWVTHRKLVSVPHWRNGAFWCIFDDFFKKYTQTHLCLYILFYAEIQKEAVTYVEKNKKIWNLTDIYVCQKFHNCSTVWDVSEISYSP